MENVPLQLKDPLIHEYAGIWPKDPFVPATKLTLALAAQFQIPIKFEYANGVGWKGICPCGSLPYSHELVQRYPQHPSAQPQEDTEHL